MEYDDSNETELECSASRLNNNNNESSKNYTLSGIGMKDNSIAAAPGMSPSSPSLSSRRNKRKNFKPRNIHEYEGSEEEGVEHCRSISKQLYRLNDTNACQNQHKIHHHAPNDFDEEHEFLGKRFERTHDDSGSDDVEGDSPLDLSEVQNNSVCKSKFTKSLASSSSTSADQHELDSLHLGSSSPHHQQHQFLHPSLSSYFTPMDLRLFSNAHNAQGLVDQRNHELNNMMNLTSCPITTNNISNNNCASISSMHDVFNGANSSYPLAAFAPDFAQSTMKELLGLYGIAENLRQAGGVTAGKPPGSMDMRNYDLSFDSSGKLDASKMMLPENMARFLAAVQESVNISNSSNSLLRNSSGGVLQSTTPTQNHHGENLSFTSPASILESSTSLFLNNNDRESDLKSNHPVNNNNGPNLNDTNSHNKIVHNSSPHYISTRGSRRRNGSPQNEKPNQSESSSQSLLARQAQANSKATKPKSTSGKSANFDLSSIPVIREGLLGKGSGPVDYTRYVKRFESAGECGHQQCQDLNYKEHFHCLQCNEGTRVFIKKDEMIRHFKWHKKRDESLQHGFMRYSSSDNCNDRFKDCPHNRKQTHYHCIHDGCVKVYVSTSDVQMHSNYHRKDSAIIQEGFQRFRATEDCRADYCGFRRQHTTHFHCRRESCQYTFKNKADMEKHKAYHIKGEQMCRDGFKKFMKHEACNYPTCRFSRVCNHIHCIRDGCNYVLHSSGQLYSHKRKHERRDSELAYRRFKLAQSLMRGTIVGTDLSSMSWSDSLPVKSDDDDISHSSSHQNDDPEESSEKQIEPCLRCELSREEHFHCQSESCRTIVLSNSEDVSEHIRNHELEDRISSLAYFTVDPANFDAQDSTIPCVSAKCPYQNSDKHYHCLWVECTEIIISSDTPFKRLEHFKTHELHKLDIVAESQEGGNASLDGFFKRKRGRPLKNRTIEVPGPNESIFTSFKLPKPIIPGSSPDPETQLKDPIGFTSYHAKSTCPDAACPFNKSPTSHYHCAHPRCHFAVKDVHKLSLHLRDFHSNVDVLDGYEYFEKSGDCQQSKCEYNGSQSHFHCTRDDYVFERYSSMASHEAEHHEVKSSYESSSDEEERSRDESSSTMKTRSSDAKSKGTNGVHAMDLSGMPDTASIDLKAISDHSLSRILQLPETSETHFGPDYACGRPFCKLKRKFHFHCHLCNQAFSEIEKLRPHILKHNNLSASSPELDTKSNSLLRSSAIELSELSIRKVGKDETNSVSNNSSPVIPSQLDICSTTIPTTLAQHPNPLTSFLGYPTSHSPYLFLQQNPFSSLYAGMMFGQNYAPSHEMLSSQLAAATAQQQQSKSLLLPSTETRFDSQSPITISNTLPIATPLKRPPSNASSPSSPPDSKKQRMQLRILKDEPVPEGYVRFRFNEDCAYPHCGYREHQTHFHCIREDCGYSFCDKTRFVQHTARHDRLDSLMGGDFKQYRANVSCGREDCTYVPATPSGTSSQGQQNKASHFHCCKCDYVCTDTNKVVAHRRQHQKMDSITAAGFEKYTPSQLCNDESCIHVQKQTHYHCVKCKFSVLGLSQMSAHKYRHDEEMSN